MVARQTCEEHEGRANGRDLGEQHVLACSVAITDRALLLRNTAARDGYNRHQANMLSRLLVARPDMNPITKIAPMP